MRSRVHITTQPLNTTHLTGTYACIKHACFDVKSVFIFPLWFDQTLCINVNEIDVKSITLNNSNRIPNTVSI